MIHLHLTGQNYNARETIQSILSPLVGVISSPLADDVCHRNNLSFVELLQPFAKLPNEAQFRDVSGTSVSIRGLRLNICDVDWRPPQTTLARKMLNESVTTAQNDRTKVVTIGNVDLELPTAEPWFEQWRETFLTVQFPADHEFTRHFLSCLLVLSSGDPNIVETAQKLTQRVQQMQSVTPQKLPKWFHPSNVLNTYVVLHEGCKGDLSRAQQGFELLKSTFGDNKCFLVPINSLDGTTAASDIPDYWVSFIKRQPKADAQADQLSAPKTPQDVGSVAAAVTAMPTMQMSSLTEATAAADLAILHPLSPVQENATEAINSKFSASSESIASQTINPNVWAADLDVDAPHGACLNAADIETLRHFVQDYAIRALIPYVEQLVAILAEAIANKKGVSKSLLSATKRWFVTSKPGAGANNQNAVIYTHESAELQTRKLGDLYFMFGHYNLAFQAYHQAKRDFNADSAWQYYAGALEMAAVSAFMLGTANRKTYDYMEDAIITYLSVCKLQQFATRATLLSIECLKTARLFGESAKQLIRMTSEESDLRSALLLEQASYCYLASQPSMHRKYGFHIVLAGNRYSRAGQRKHAYRCYRQAYQVFHGHGWTLAEDHIQYTMAKHAYTLKKLEEASQSFAHLLRPASLQSAGQQAYFLKEYIQTQNELIKRSPDLGLLPLALPQVVQDSIRVLVTAHPPTANAQFVVASGVDIRSDQSDDPIWHRIEEMLVTTAAANKPLVFKPSRSLFTKESPATEYPLAIQSEPIEISVTLVNTIRCGISLTGIDLLWKLRLDNEEELSNVQLYERNANESPNTAAVSAAIKTACSQEVRLEQHADRKLYFKLTPKLTGRLSIIGIVGQVAANTEPSASLLGSLQFESQRIQPSAAASLSGSVSSKQPLQTTLFDNKLSIEILPSLPSLSVSFSPVPRDLLAGEVVPVTISLRNSGIVPIDNIFIGCDDPRWITLLDKDGAQVPLSVLSSIKDLSNEKLVKDKEIRRQHVFRLPKRADAITGVALRAQEGTTATAWIQAPYQRGDFTLRLLFYYSLPTGGTTSASKMKYRLVRHSWEFEICKCLRSDFKCFVSDVNSDDLSLNVNVHNQTETHNLLFAELYITSMALYCAEYKLNANKLNLTNPMELGTGQLGERCLEPAKAASFQCFLEKVNANDIAMATTTAALNEKQLLKQRLTSMDIMPPTIDSATTTAVSQNTPPLGEMYSFLAKYETVFFPASITSEEFNSAVARKDPHATVALSWMATVIQGTRQRIAYGQHFVQLRSFSENVSCPPSPKMVTQFFGDESSMNICDFASVGTEATTTKSAVDNGDNNEDEDVDDNYDVEEEHWEHNDHFVGRRCLLEDESFTLALKA